MIVGSLQRKRESYLKTAAGGPRRIADAIRCLKNRPIREVRFRLQGAMERVQNRSPD